MKKLLSLILLLCAIYLSFAQAPGVKWLNYYSPDSWGNYVFYDIKAVPDGGFILAGADTAHDYNKNEYLKKSVGGGLALMKTDKDGNVLWNQGLYDFSAYDASYMSIQVDRAGEIIAVGYGVTYPHPEKYYITKFDKNGAELWNKSYGGTTGTSRAYSVQQTTDDGYIVAGITTSNDGDVSGNHNTGTADTWLLKLDGNGSIQWKKCFGGTGEDSAYAVIQAPDGGFVVAGASTSVNGDLTGNNGLSDAWIFKVNSNGTLLWQKNIGGSNDEDFKSIILNSDTSYTVTGYTLSSSVTDNGIHGNRDLWVAKIKDATGQIQWSKSFGGAKDEEGYSIQRTVGNGYLITGYTESVDGDVTNNNGSADAWLLNLTYEGNLIWQKCIGTNKDEFGMAGVYLTETDFAIAGFGEPTVPQSNLDFTDAFMARLGNINTIKGSLFNDANLNGVKDLTEAVFNEAGVTTIKSGYERTAIAQNGLFSIKVDTGSYTTAVKVHKPYYNVVPASITSTFSTYFNTDSVSFAIQPIPGMKDLVISVIPTDAAIQGFNVLYKIYYKNAGTTNISSGEILFKHDSRLDFVSSSPVFSSSTGDTLKWNFSNLQPLDTASILVNLQVQTPPAVNLGDTLTSVAIITPVTGDVTPGDDTAYLKQRVFGSYDPNDKAENNAGHINSQYVTDGNYLNYMIRFQNTGTDTAVNVIVRDTLSDKLDWNTLQMISGSHLYNLAIENGNKLAWSFNNIQLADSNVNEPASHGYIAYRIKPKNNLVAGDSIHNTGSIYFDFNLPVITNNAFTVVQDIIVLPLQLLSFSGAYNNGQATLHWSTSNDYNFEKFEIERSLNGINYNSIGLRKSNRTNNIVNYQLQDNLANVNGSVFYYRLKMLEPDGRVTYSRVILVRKDDKPAEGITITPNPVLNGQAFLIMTSKSRATIDIKVVDMHGKTVLRQQNNIFEGRNTIMVNSLYRLAPGVYTIQIINGKNKTAANFELVR